MRRSAVLAAAAIAVSLGLAGPAAGHVPTTSRSGLTGMLGQEMMAEAGKKSGPTAWASAQSGTPPATPRPDCGPGSRPETDMQGRVPAGSTRGFTCNLEQLGHEGQAGGFKVERFVDKAGHECAYYDTTLQFPLNAQYADQPTGVAVLDMSNPAKPKRTTTLVTPAMQTPHESVLLNARRGLLAAVMGNAFAYPGFIDIYDLNSDCRQPALQSSLPVGLLGHESGFAPDGKTFYATSLSTGQVTAVDVSDPKAPVTLAVGQFPSHGLTISDDGNRAYMAGRDIGLQIVDVSEIQSRKPNPQFHEISRLTWDTLTIPQVAIPVTIGGHKYAVEVDEFSTDGGGSTPAGNGKKVGAARIIDIENEKAPKVVSDIRLAVNQPENRAKVGGDPGADSFLQGYAAHYCAVPQRKEPGIVACSFIASGLRVFDIRDPRKPTELAYFVAPPGHNPYGGAPSNYAMSAATFVPERREIWYSDGTTGLYTLRVAKGVWPFAGGASARGCLSPRSPIGPRNIGRVRLGYTRKQLLRRVPSPRRTTPRSWRWCVRGGKGTVAAAFTAKGRVALVSTTAPRHGNRRLRPGSRLRRLRSAYPRRRSLGRGLFRANPRSPRLIGVRRGRVRFIAVTSRRVLRRRAELRRYLRLAGVR